MKLVFLPPRPWDLKLDFNQTLEEFPNDTFNHLIRLGVDVEIIKPTFSDLPRFKKINPFILGLDFIRALKVLIFRRNVDFVISIQESGGFFLLLLRKIFLFKPKIILWDLSSGNSWRLVKFIQKIVLPRYDAFMLLTSVQKKYLEDLNFQGKKTLIYYNVDEQFLKPYESKTGDYILSIGDDVSRDYETLIKSVDGISQQLIIKSNWNLPDSIKLNPSQIKFIKQRMNNFDYRDLISKAKILVLPMHNSVHAGGITFLFEAMAMAKPIIVTKSSLTEDFLVNLEDSLVVPVGDSEALKAAIIKLIEEPLLREKIASNLRKKLDQSFTTNNLALRIKLFLEKF